MTFFQMVYDSKWAIINSYTINSKLLAWYSQHLNIYKIIFENSIVMEIIKYHYKTEYFFNYIKFKFSKNIILGYIKTTALSTFRVIKLFTCVFYNNQKLQDVIQIVMKNYITVYNVYYWINNKRFI